ncbi:2-hydroxychromene-2-carboxylate isomerase [Lysobacter sp. D1-1-M9]|uniref:2-hydroxychromene-2-carboxylate isomerase n=1 Tax=Novilysobacter longmucuonensis TaxID=3098603 RepID=UPI002FC5C5B6
MMMRWYFDFLSPFSYLQWQKLKALRDGHDITPVPIMFAAVLDAHGQKGPAEIRGKREFTYRHVLWQARQEGVALRFPPAHPFNPLPALRACIAAGGTAQAVDAIFAWIWAAGRAADSVDALAPLLDTLGIEAAALSADVTKAALRANTEAAIAAGVYGVPTLAIGEQLFWGNDAHEFAMAALEDPSLLTEGEMRRVATLPVGIQRRG